MSHKNLADLNAEQKKEVFEKLYKGINYRSENLAYVFALAYLIYSFGSHEFLLRFDKSISIWDNTWPRIIFNTIPFLLIAFLNRNENLSQRKRVFLNVFSFPIIFTIACLIYVWPLISKGNPDLYLYVHSANMFILSVTMITLSLTLKLNILLSCLYIGLFFIPVSILIYPQDKIIFNTFLSDFLIMLSLSSYTAFLTYKLRLKLAISDITIRESITPFLGKHLTRSIYENGQDQFEGRIFDTFVLNMDLRGFSNLNKILSREKVHSFLKDYHNGVATIIGESHGNLHKSAGDAHISSFGEITQDDLHEIPGIENELEKATNRQKEYYLEKAIVAYDRIVRHLEALKQKYEVNFDLQIGGAICYGPLEYIIRGDSKYHKEVDIHGEILIRSSRLEAYTKVLKNNINSNASYLILSPELESYLEKYKDFQVWNINQSSHFVRDYNEITKLFYQSWASSNIQNRAAA